MRNWITLGLGFLVSTGLVAQEPVAITPRVKPGATSAPTAIDRRANIRIDTTLVLVPVAVTDPMQRFVTGLDRDNFKVFEDKTEREITQFSSEDAPMSVGLV